MDLQGHRAELQGQAGRSGDRGHGRSLCSVCVHCVSLALDKPVRSTLLTTGLRWHRQQCAAIYRDNFIVMATLKEAALIEYADQLNRKVRLTRQTKAKPERGCPSLCLVSGWLPYMNESSGGPLCLACLRNAWSPLPSFPTLGSHAQCSCRTLSQDPALKHTESPPEDHKMLCLDKGVGLTPIRGSGKMQRPPPQGIHSWPCSKLLHVFSDSLAQRESILQVTFDSTWRRGEDHTTGQRHSTHTVYTD